MKRICLFLLALGTGVRAAGADPTNLPPIIVTASRGAEPVTKVAASTDTHSATALGEAQA
ncbi:MAG: hypothetical protein GX565_14090, partial [Lentisphaerae bacterium]|nr:hypothetical protein [Lentisphaerota bacterium]